VYAVCRILSSLAVIWFSFSRPNLKQLSEPCPNFKLLWQLMHEVVKKGGTIISKATDNTGRIYNSWKELKNRFLQKKNVSIFEIIQFDTNAALRIYKKALFAVSNIPADTLDLVATQRVHLGAEYERLKLNTAL
jgi:hypothetical protein